MGDKSVVMCCYYFPPFARSGGMRSMQFGRRLAALGWDVEVLAADPRLYESPVDPASVADGYAPPEWGRVTTVGLREIPPHHHASRWREFVSTLTDPWRAEGIVLRRWIDAATEAADAALRRRPGSVLYIGMQPYAAALVGLRMQQRHGVKWVADLADPWTLDEVNSYASVAHFWRQRRLFRRVLRAADAVIANTPEAARAMIAFEPSARARTTVLTYGYDRENVPPESAPARDDGRFELVHLGAIEVAFASSARANPLRYRPYGTDVAARGTHYLLGALARLRDVRPDLFARLRLRVVSSRTDNELAAVRAQGMLDQFEWTGVLPNAEALREVARAHAALVLQQGAPQGHRLRTVRAKTYEYMAVGKPVLACVPGGDGADFVARYGRGLTRDPSSVDQIVGGLCELYDRYDEIARAPVDRAFVEQFEWGALARQLDGVMTGLSTAPAR